MRINNYTEFEFEQNGLMFICQQHFFNEVQNSHWTDIELEDVVFVNGDELPLEALTEKYQEEVRKAAHNYAVENIKE